MLLVNATDAVTRGASRTSVALHRQELAELTLTQFQRARDADLETRRVLIGLVEACTRFNPEEGVFTAFAYSTINGLLERHFRDHAWSVRPPRGTQTLSAELWRRWPEVAQVVGGEPTQRQLAETLGTRVDEVRRAEHAGQACECSSLDATTREHVVDDLDGDRCEARMLIESVWSELTVPEQSLLKPRFYEERSQGDIALELGTTQMQVSRLLRRLMIKLRGLIGALDETPADAA